jgi:hypothetical protein
MRVDKLPKWVLILIGFITVHIIGKWFIPALLSWLAFLGLHGVPLHLVGLTVFVLLIYETLGKFFILQSVKSPKFEATKVENWPHVNLDGLTYYNNELEKLGFTLLGDYTAPAIKGMLRLFAHPELGCFAEVVQSIGHPIYCEISNELEAGWVMSVTNFDSSPSIRATSYAFLRLPRKIHRFVLKATPAVLLETLLEWRSQVTKDLSIQPLKDVSAEMFFAQTHKRFIKMRNRLWWSSIAWRRLESLFFRLKPKADWLGEYPKLKDRRANTARLT